MAILLLQIGDGHPSNYYPQHKTNIRGGNPALAIAGTDP
jgi:hypothetical protein